jgi:hypothetical protein
MQDLARSHRSIAWSGEANLKSVELHDLCVDPGAKTWAGNGNGKIEVLAFFFLVLRFDVSDRKPGRARYSLKGCQ